MEGEIGAGMWPWITLVAVIVAFLVGMYFGKPRALLSWGDDPCNQSCNCGGINCTVPTGEGQTHTHCPNQATEATSCPGKCTNSAGPGHAGPHYCSHGHVF